jgi:hypothetical protein
MIAVDRASVGSGGRLAASVTQSFTTGSFSTLRLQQLLARLGYLPLTWTPTSRADISAGNANAELSAAYQPPAGTFGWTYFSRGGYGYNQSLGCVELPSAAAKMAYPYLTYGTLVTVTGPVGA